MAHRASNPEPVDRVEARLKSWLRDGERLLGREITEIVVQQLREELALRKASGDDA